MWFHTAARQASQSLNPAKAFSVRTIEDFSHNKRPFYRLCPFAKAVTTLICSFPAWWPAFINFDVWISGSDSVFRRIKGQKFHVSGGVDKRFDDRDQGCTGYAGSDRGEIYPVFDPRPRIEAWRTSRILVCTANPLRCLAGKH
jgi:hypothetical protein